MRRRGGPAGGADVVGDLSHVRRQSMLTRAVESVFAFVRFAEFEIIFVLFFLVAFLVFKDLTSRPEYNGLLVKKPGGDDFWP